LVIEKSPRESEAYMTNFMMPQDANLRGNVFGGTIMKLIDEISGITAVRHTRGNVVTASIDRMDFIAPIYIGDILRLKSSINYVGTTSMEIGVRIEAEDPRTGQIRHTGTCFLTYVALDEHGRPREVPKLKLETDEDRRRWEEAAIRRKLRMQQIGRIQ
jgi:acyl-CoA hydrolase